MKTTGNCIDLEGVARTEAEDGDLFSLFNELFEAADVRPEGYPDAVVWQTGNFDGEVKEVAHALTDRFALVGTLAAIDILNLPCFLVPLWAQYRHDMELAPLAWFGNMPRTSIKWSTAGDAYVLNGQGERVVVSGKSGNAQLRTMAGVYCNVRPYGNITVVRSMPGLPYSQDRKAFRVGEDGVVHSEMNTPGVQMAYAIRRFLRIVHETNQHGRVAFKPTQAMEDGIQAGLLSWMLQSTCFDIQKCYSVDGYVEHRAAVDRIIALLPENFKAGMQNWGGTVTQHIADTAYGLLLKDLVAKTPVVYLATDLDGDRLTDLLADASDPLRDFAARMLKHFDIPSSVDKLWKEMGYTTGNGRDMTSVMYRMVGDPIFEQTLGSADEMLRRLLAGEECAKGKKPYDPRIHFVLIADAYKAANPEHRRLHDYLDNALAVLDSVYTPDQRPSFFEGYRLLKEAITPW